MAQKEIELILMRNLASYLTTPIFVVDPEGTLLFYNEPAEALLGVRFDEAGEMSASQLATIFNTTDEEGRPIPSEAGPLALALREQRPQWRRLWIVGLDGVRRKIAVIAVPLVGQGQRLLGAAAIFWDVNAT